MARTGPLIWFWSLVILPFTAILTFIATLVVCSQVPHNVSPGVKFPQISQLGTGPAYYYFASGFIILVPQFFLILIGRLQFLFQSQMIVNRAIICAIHALALLSCVFLLIMALVSVDDRPRFHVTGAFGMFGFISLYCFLHTILVFYLFARRSEAPRHSNILWPLWFLACSIVLVTFFIVWLVTAKGIPQYIAAATPFLYLLGFIPQFWQQAITRKRDEILPVSMRYSNEISL